MGPRLRPKDHFTPFEGQFDFPVLNHQFHVDSEDSTCSHLGDGLLSFTPCVKSLSSGPQPGVGPPRPWKCLEMYRGISDCFSDSRVLSGPGVRMLNTLQCTGACHTAKSQPQVPIVLSLRTTVTMSSVRQGFWLFQGFFFFWFLCLGFFVLVFFFF